MRSSIEFSHRLKVSSPSEHQCFVLGEDILPMETGHATALDDRKVPGRLDDATRLSQRRVFIPHLKKHIGSEYDISNAVGDLGAAMGLEISPKHFDMV
jgi:hypothetical protein